MGKGEQITSLLVVDGEISDFEKDVGGRHLHASPPSPP